MVLIRIITVALVLALAGCSDASSLPPQETPTAEPGPRTASPIDQLDAYAFCRVLVTSRLPADRSIAAQVEDFTSADITAVDDTFEVTLSGPASGGTAKTLCVLTGTLGDPRLLYSGDPAGWPAARDAALAATPHRAIDPDTRGDKSAPIDELLAWASCRVLRLAQEPADYIAGWADFNTASLSRGRQGIEVYEVFPAGKADAAPVDTSSFCVIDGTLAQPYPVVYLEKGPGGQNARDYYLAVLADPVERSL